MKIDQDQLREVSFKAFEARVIFKYNKVENKKPKLLESYLNKVARVLGVQREKSE